MALPICCLTVSSNGQAVRQSSYQSSAGATCHTSLLATWTPSGQMCEHSTSRVATQSEHDQRFRHHILLKLAPQQSWHAQAAMPTSTPCHSHCSPACLHAISAAGYPSNAKFAGSWTVPRTRTAQTCTSVWTAQHNALRMTLRPSPIQTMSQS